jgi:hypothetical protein
VDANKDIVRGIKGHAEIGGFGALGIKVLEMSAEIGRRADLPPAYKRDFGTPISPDPRRSSPSGTLRR